MNNLEPLTYELPAYWASYLINNDASGIGPTEEYEADRWLAERNLPMPVSCGEQATIGRFDGLVTELLDYTFLVEKGADDE